MNRYYNILTVTFLCFLIACGGNNNEHYNTILKSEQGDFRGVEIGMSKNQVKKLEDTSFLKDEMPTYLHYDIPINMGNSYTVAYDFSEDEKLYEIEVSVFFDVIEDAQTLLEDFENTFTKKYGNGSNSDDGFIIWNNKSNGKNIEIAMKNDSDTYGYLSLVIRDLDY